MKKILALLGIAAFSLAYSQGGTLILNNYSAYDFSGYIVANNFAGGCYPYITSNDPEMVKVPADSHMGNGNELRYTDFRNQYTTSLYPMAAWHVSTSSALGISRPWNHGSLMPGGTFSNNTKWATTKFVMYYPGTTNLAPDNFNGALTLPGNISCYNAPNYFSTPSGSNSAEIFTITSGASTTTYIQLY
ncbi:hypothetical protein ACM46_06970 [Chryseobacterium angstadtii]|uniref:Uncharacterized protein n=1 Tax=Chryseobacterium angstadtii TaxID=558151 RepID=A0A0J7IGT8_9FLAO|nr:hypothetical protein [Chryseobacterium angstadtii]KMQ65613.1 hypothetical protein ACM46_06970 [Chryseobacterium angstadtii]